MIAMAGGTFGYDLSFRAVAGNAAFDSGHKNIGSQPAPGGVMAIVAFHHGMLRVIEPSLRHPAIDETRSGNERRSVGHGLHVVAESAAVK